MKDADPLEKKKKLSEQYFKHYMSKKILVTLVNLDGGDDSVNEWINLWMTEVIVEQLRLHRAC